MDPMINWPICLQQGCRDAVLFPIDENRECAALGKQTGNKVSRFLLCDAPKADARLHRKGRHSFKRLDLGSVCSLDVSESSAN